MACVWQAGCAAIAASMVGAYRLMRVGVYPASSRVTRSLAQSAFMAQEARIPPDSTVGTRSRENSLRGKSCLPRERTKSQRGRIGAASCAWAVPKFKEGVNGFNGGRETPVIEAIEAVDKLGCRRARSHVPSCIGGLSAMRERATQEASRMAASVATQVATQVASRVAV